MSQGLSEVWKCSFSTGSEEWRASYFPSVSKEKKDW